MLEGFRFDLETRTKPKTVEYYSDRVKIFVRWANNGGHLANPILVTKRHIQSFLHELAGTATTLVGNGAKIQIQQTGRSRWPYYRALKCFFAWAVQEGHFEQNPMDGIELKPPKDPPVEPYRTDQIASLFKVLDHDWQVAVTERQRMLAARDMAILSSPATFDSSQLSNNGSTVGTSLSGTYCKNLPATSAYSSNPICEALLNRSKHTFQPSQAA